MIDWPAHLPATRVRIARPTDQFDALVAFYRDALGLPELGGFQNHDGYTGMMLGLPGEGTHLEITTHTTHHAGRAPNRDSLLVLYIDDNDAIAALVKRMASHGHTPVPPENPYWALGGVTFEDPDGYGLVLMNMTERRRLLAENG